MARPKKSEGGESVQGYFRRIFDENPKLLKRRSNEELYQRWLQDHPGEKEVPERVRQGLSNLKSVLRNRRRKRRRLRQAENGEAPTQARAVAPRNPNALVRLESQIDDALLMARQFESQGLDEVVRLLRSARNRVIVALG